MRNVKFTGLLLILMLLLAACGGGATNNGGGTTDTGTDAGEPAAPAAQESAVMVDNELAFHPAEFTAATNQEFNVTMENTGALEHNWVWDDEGDEENPFLYTAPGETDTASRTFTEAGTYGFYCSIPGHREAGMVGEVTVE